MVKMKLGCVVICRRDIDAWKIW